MCSMCDRHKFCASADASAEPSAWNFVFEALGATPGLCRNIFHPKLRAQNPESWVERYTSAAMGQPACSCCAAEHKDQPGDNSLGPLGGSCVLGTGLRLRDPS